MNDNEFSEFESRYYINPTTSRDEQISFIDTLRDTQAQNTAQINADTYALGSQLPSNLGGLSGAEDTFVARYQKPQTEQTVADLRTAAQQTALNQALSNLQNAYKKRYNDAILNYQKRSAAANNNNSNTGKNGDVNFNPFQQYPTESYISGGAKGSATVLMPDGRQGVYELDSNGNIGAFIGYADDPKVVAQFGGNAAVQFLQNAVRDNANRVTKTSSTSTPILWEMMGD